MPMRAAEDFGTAAAGSRSKDYCHFCFQNGAFVNPGMTKQGMIDLCVHVMNEKGIMPEPQARALMEVTIPTLKRWRTAMPPSPARA
jgi:hypothetical protein